MININKELSDAMRSGILEIYRNMVINDDVDQVSYVNNKIFQKVAMLQNSEIEMERYLSAYAKIMFELFNYETREQPLQEYHKYMISALYYFCDPYDYFPDMHHDDAHLDDALVVNQCLEILKEQSRDTYKHISNYIRDSNI